MNSNYQEALKLYNQCDYEGAYNILLSYAGLENKGHRLLEECKKQILQQYIYLIKENEKKGI